MLTVRESGTNLKLIREGRDSLPAAKRDSYIHTLLGILCNHIDPEVMERLVNQAKEWA